LGRQKAHDERYQRHIHAPVANPALVDGRHGFNDAVHWDRHVLTLRPRFLTPISIHKALGIAIPAIALFRVGACMRRGAAPSRRSAVVAGSRGQGIHILPYGLLIVRSLVGWSAAGGYPIVLDGSIHLLPTVPHNDARYAFLWASHPWLAFLFFVTILMQVAAALFRAPLRHDGVFESMAQWRSWTAAK
jgi:cytochrome b561